MDTFITDLVSFIWPWTIVFCLFVALAVVLVRKIVERVFPLARMSWWWNEVVLYLLPMLLGAVTALSFLQYPFPEMVKAASTRFVYGVVCGGLSGFVYKMAKSVLKKKAAEAGIEVKVGPDSEPKL